MFELLCGTPLRLHAASVATHRSRRGTRRLTTNLQHTVVVSWQRNPKPPYGHGQACSWTSGLRYRRGIRWSVYLVVFFAIAPSVGRSRGSVW